MPIESKAPKVSLSKAFLNHQGKLVLCALCAIFLAIVLSNITRTSIWGDEGFSVMSIGGGGGV